MSWLNCQVQRACSTSPAAILAAARFSAGGPSLVSSSRRWRPVSETNTSSRLTCRVVRRIKRPLAPVELVEQGGDRAVRLRRPSANIRRSRPAPQAPSRGPGTNRLRSSAARARSLERELDDMIAAQPGDQLGRRSLGDDLALVDDRHPVAEPLGLVHVVRRQDDRAAAIAQVANHVPELPPRLRVEAGRRLVQEEDLGVAHQGDARPPAAAAGRPESCSMNALALLSSETRAITSSGFMPVL